jgi:hypothetical protein
MLKFVTFILAILYLCRSENSPYVILSLGEQMLNSTHFDYVDSTVKEGLFHIDVWGSYERTLTP